MPPQTASAGGLRASASDQADSVQAALEAFAGAQSGYAEDQRAVLSLNALNSLARILAGLPGRKSIIWVTGNLPFSLVPENRTMTDAELEETLPSLNTRRVIEHASVSPMPENSGTGVQAGQRAGGGLSRRCTRSDDVYFN